MATLVYLDTNNERGAQISEAINQIRDGLATLNRFDGLRAQLISVSAAEFGAQFGIANSTEAQAFNDRMGAITAGTYTGLSDFLDATVDGEGSIAGG